MYNRFLNLLVFILLIIELASTSHQKSNTRNNLTHQKSTTYQPTMEELFSDRDAIDDRNVNRTLDREEVYTTWSSWSRCTDCFQRRMKECISIRCEGSRMYEERPCKKNRCKRKSRQKNGFHVVHLDEDNSYLTKQAPSDIWSRWSKWSPCSQNCRTYRIRRCKKPGRCHKQIQNEQAYCYHESSVCQLYVLNLMESERENSYDNRRYQYTNNNQDVTTIREPKRHHRSRRCGIPNRRTKMLKIIGGTEAKRYKWPWHVAVLNQHMEVFCGGTLIAARWVLTANHCIRKYLRVRLNAYDLRASDGSDIEMTVSKMFPHPKFDYKTVDNDIALLMLPRPVSTQVACLPKKRAKPGQLCSVMGWGKINTDDVYGVPILNEAKLPIVPPRTCKKSYREFFISDNMVCAGWMSGKADTCAGDSGGGLMCPSKRFSKTIFSVQGITSFGDGCGRKNKYGIYTTVFNYVRWIHYIMDHYS